MIHNSVELNRQQAPNGQVANNYSREFGDKLNSKKNKEQVRIVFQNVNGFGYAYNDVKSERIRNFIEENNVDTMMMAEINTNWRIINQRNSMHQIGKRWFERCKIINSFNVHKKSRLPYLPGGVAIMSIGSLSYRINKWDLDERRMGRWASQLIQGKNNLRTRLVTVYVPTKPYSQGERKVFNQQKEALLCMGITTPVLQAFWDDFWTQIDIWLNDGEQLIIGGDWNSNVTKDNFLRPFIERNLIPAVQSRHGKNLPATYSKGSVPIDEIFISSTLTLSHSGFLAHGSAPGDHCAVWIEVKKNSMIGTNLPKNKAFQARKLKCRIPRVVKKYNTLLQEYCKRYGIYERVYNLLNSFSVPLTLEQIKEYEKLDKLKTQAMEYAETNCRKFYHGGYKWSDSFQQARDKIEYYELSISRLKGSRVSSRILMRLSRRTGCNALGKSVHELEMILSSAYKNYKIIRKDDESHRRSFLERLAEDMEKAGKGKKSNIIKQLINIEEKRLSFKKAGIHQ